MKLETHLHSKNGSGCGQLDYLEILEIYKNLGYGGIVLTEHFANNVLDSHLGGNTFKDKVNIFIENFNRFEKLAKSINMKSFFGAEISYHFDDGEYCHLVATGIERSFFDEDILSMDIQSLFEYCQKKGALLHQAHPFRIDNKLMPTKFLDGVEVYNGGNGNKDAKSNIDAKKWAQKSNKIMLSGSDFHGVYHAGRGGIIVPDDIITSSELVNYLKNNQFQLIKDGEIV